MVAVFEWEQKSMFSKKKSKWFSSFVVLCVPLFFSSGGCAIKSGVTMVQMEKAYQQYNTVENRKAQFEWAMAESYMQKSKEEYASSEFEDAELLAKKSIEWMKKAETSAKIIEEE